MSRFDMARDVLVTRVCNFLLRNFASGEYTDKLKLIVAHGLTEADAGRVPGLRKGTDLD